MESIWALSPQTAERLYAIAIAAICLGAIVTLASLVAFLSAISGHSKLMKLQLALAEARTREAEAAITASKLEQDRLKLSASLEPAAPEAVASAPTRRPRGLSTAQKAILTRRLGDQLPAMQFKLAIAAADDAEAQGLGLQLMQFFEDEGVALVAQRNPRAPYPARDEGASNAEMLVKYKSIEPPPFAQNLREALVEAGVAAELKRDSGLNLEEVQLVVLGV